VPCIWAFLISLKKMSFPTGSEDVIPELSYAKILANLLNEKRRLDT
jgi:hypothetical protein